MTTNSLEGNRTRAASPGSLLGTGLYMVAEAGRLTGIPPASIRRWLWGRPPGSEDRDRGALPLWRPQVPILDRSRALGFRDLIEIRFVHAFRQRGVSLQTIRKATEEATRLLQQDHPFSSLGFKTDGKNILAEVTEGTADGALLFDVLTGQYLLEIVFDRLYDGLEYSELDELLRWWPLGLGRGVVLDPERSFGQPIVHPAGVPTAVLADAFTAEQSVEAVADWYEVTTDAVRDALEYESALRAA